MSGDIIDFKSKLKRSGGGDEPPTEGPNAGHEEMIEVLLEYISLAELGELSAMFIGGVDKEGKCVVPEIIYTNPEIAYKLPILASMVKEGADSICLAHLEPRDSDWEDEDI